MSDRDHYSHGMYAEESVVDVETTRGKAPLVDGRLTPLKQLIVKESE